VSDYVRGYYGFPASTVMKVWMACRQVFLILTRQSHRGWFSLTRSLQR